MVEWIINFINLPVQYVLIVASFYLLSGRKITRKELLNSIIKVFIPASIIYQFVYWLGIIYLIISLVLYFSVSRKNEILYWISIVIIAIISDHLATTFIYSIIIHTETYRLILRLILFVIIHLIIIYLIYSLKTRYNLKIPSSIYWVITLLVIITLGIFYFNIFRIYNQTSIEALRVNTLFLIFYFMLTLTLICVIVYINIKIYVVKQNEIEFKNFTEYVQSVEKVNSEMQKFRHDYLNILLGIKGYIKERDLNGLEEYFNKGIFKFEIKTLESNKILGNLNNIQDLSLKGLLFNKASSAIEKDLAITIEVPSPIKVPSNSINLTRILGNLIDNAIENCIEEGTKGINIAIIKQDTFTLFVIQNELKNTDINISKIFTEGYTTKIYGQGLGLANIKKIIDNSPELTLNIWINDCWFNAELFLKGE
ncbi:sensor histidine kinase [Metalysinibacillus jejuensis]|uniref:sensor histidine kinase n=1 Tax=Metalysinibacillus jejuensis TaxID=914327 RepID=UPI000D35B758|nr:GHKL domain-containing protein [Metalysinibacillus jejuensis]